MARHHRWSMSELLQWAEWGFRDDRLPDLLRPQGLVWPRDGGELESAWDALCAHYGRLPVMQALAGAVLAGGEGAPGWARPWCAEHIDLQELGLGFDWDAALSMRWSVAPLALSLGGFSRLDWVLVGVAPRPPGLAPVPAWWGLVADSEARQAADDALTVLHERAGMEAVLWPMVADTGRVRIRGPSLGLPLYLAARGLSRGLDPRDLLATGRLDGRGRLHPVGSLDQKADLAVSAGFHGLVAPASGRCGAAGSPGFEILEVTDLEQAEFLWETYSAGCGELLLQQIRCVDDPAWLAAHVHLIHREVLRWPPPGGTAVPFPGVHPGAGGAHPSVAAQRRADGESLRLLPGIPPEGARSRDSREGSSPRRRATASGLPPGPGAGELRQSLRTDRGVAVLGRAEP